ncbi:oxidoreductase [Streptomyces oceani]|uniref:Short-chain dehydrogenase n=1 Tax=Streptomyces oceani TaxID=1075402 RepID=A0A1E7KFJ9_9ACTN|nr:oxidoreductase [Streptomyces oceani]OEV02675.1 short-chain dehydrogenase [Streptomyces oceani]
MSWTARDIPDQSDRIAVVTGANSGLGLVTARELARRGARVVLACRSDRRGKAAVEQLLAQTPEARVEYRALDLADLASVRAFAEDLPHERVDILINNAGLMAIPYAETADGFETQFGVNHLGHFALTGLLLERLLAAEYPRVVNVSSLAHTLANLDIRDLQSRKHYGKWEAYARSKTANLLFTHELARRTSGHPLIAASAHPGYSATELQAKGPRMAGQRGLERAMRLSLTLVASSPELGAAPSLYAATAPGVAPDSFVGPRFLGVRGGPGAAWRAPWTRDDLAGELLWDASRRLTGVDYAPLGS